TAAGVAFAQFAYSFGGYALKEAAHDIEVLRQHFAAKYGAPRATWVGGVSLGGSVSVMLMESYSDRYDGGLPMCAPFGPDVAYAKILVFDLLVLFEYWFPNVLPSPAAVPKDYTITHERPAALAELLNQKPEAAAALRRRSSARTNH